ncbi:MAG: PTS glucose transporter subunit IIA [Traorella sp.]
MFGFKKKDEVFQVVACVDGKCIPLEEVKDPVFSQKMMGDGFAIIPTSDTIVSPVNGTIQVVFPTKHAIGIKRKDGIEILLHIGIDTVNLNGRGFNSLVKPKMKVKAGQPLLKVDRQTLTQEGYDLTVMVIFTSGYQQEIKLSCFHESVKANDVLLSK